MISEVVADVHLLNLTILVLALNKDVFKEVIIVLLHLVVRHIGQVGTISCLCGILEEIK